MVLAEATATCKNDLVVFVRRAPKSQLVLYLPSLAVFPGAIPALSSPYLNIDPSALQEAPQYIFPEGASKQRGRFELAFSQIGGSVMLGWYLCAPIPFLPPPYR